MTITYYIVLFICFLISVAVSAYKTNPALAGKFTLFTGITLITELGNYFHIFPLIRGSNHWTFNIETVFEFYFFSWFFYNILMKRTHKVFIKCFVISYPVILFVSFFTIQVYYVFHTYTYILGEFYIVILCFFYYRELYTRQPVQRLSSLPEFWIVTGLFIFTAGELPYLILLNYLNKYYMVTSFYLKQYILGTLNIVMYVMFSVGLLYSTWIKK